MKKSILVFALLFFCHNLLRAQEFIFGLMEKADLKTN